MARVKITIEGSLAWEFYHQLPCLWLWMFDWKCITESRRLHSTVYESAAQFEDLLGRVRKAPAVYQYLEIFEEIRPDIFPRELDTNPDAIMALDLAELEAERPFKYETAVAHWREFFRACDHGDEEAALICWEKAVLSPFVPSGGKQRDALLIKSIGKDLRLPDNERAKTLVWCLYGEPVSRPAKALASKWVNRAERLPAVGFQPSLPWWKRLFTGKTSS